MPLYDFKCCKCKKEFEQIVKTNQKITYCDCGYIAIKTKTPTKAGFRLKGIGWYNKSNPQ